jgi:glycosyltransferase involved in cell wall biosynthesis
VLHISRLLAQSGETVHVIGQLWEGAEKKVEEKCGGRLIIHRIPFEKRQSIWGRKPSPLMDCHIARNLFKSDYFPQSFSWQAGMLAESIIGSEGIDIVEGQEYEAPLYYLMVRRALGLGPDRRPPCLVHLHSPSEFIARYNDWDPALPRVLTAKRLEDYTIASADGLLCPSRYLAHQVEACYGFEKGSVEVIPYPAGDIRVLKRDEKVWNEGTICYVGRLERRKGVVEWLDAALAVCHQFPHVHFELVGANYLETEDLSARQYIRHKIPSNLRHRFHFRGERDRRSLGEFMGKARMAVVPSRWENFPYVCIEAMGSGLPVIASPEGGMAEMIEDGRTGWIASGPESSCLEEALRRALHTPPAAVAEMGFNAASSIRKICDNADIASRHLDFRNRVVQAGSKRSSSIPASLPWAGKPRPQALAPRSPHPADEQGTAIIVTSFNTGEFLDKTLQSIKTQTIKPAAVILVDAGSTEGKTLEALRRASSTGWQVICKNTRSVGPSANAGIEEIINSGRRPACFFFLRPGCWIEPWSCAVFESTFQHCPEIGLISGWSHISDGNGKIRAMPCPSFPYQWLRNEVAPFSAIRTQALLEAGKFRLLGSNEYEEWDLFNAVMAAGWAAVTFPGILGGHPADPTWTERPFKRIHGELLGRFADLVAHDATDIALLAGSCVARLHDQGYPALREQADMIRVMVENPRNTIRLVFWALEEIGMKLLKVPFSSRISAAKRVVESVFRRMPNGGRRK